MTTKKTRKERIEETQKKILQTTKKMIEEKGYSELTTTKIAEKANISVGIIYKYFPQGKASIVKDIFKNGIIGQVDEELITNMDEDTIIGFIKEIMRTFVFQHRQNEALLKAMATAVLTHEEVFNDFAMLDHSEYEITDNIVQQMKDLKLFPEKASEETGRLLLRVVDGLIHQHVVFQDIFENDTKLIDFLTELVSNSVHFKTLMSPG